MLAGVRLACALLLLLLLTTTKGSAHAALSISSGAGDEVALGGGAPTSFPPALEAHPGDPDAVLLETITDPPFIGVSTWRVDPLLPLVLHPGYTPIELPGDLNGSLPDPGPSAIMNDLRVGSGALGWIHTQNYETVVPFSADSALVLDVLFDGITRKSVPTDIDIAGTFVTSTGAAVGADCGGNPAPCFDTRITEDVLRVGNALLVSSANLKSASPELYPGTVLLYDIADPQATPLDVSLADPQFIVTSDFNPAGLTPLPGGLVAITNTGALGVSGQGNGVAITAGSIDILDPQTPEILGSIPLGFAAPGLRRLALDPTGSVGVASSAVRRELFAVDLRRLDELEPTGVDPGIQRTSCNDTAADVADGVPCLRDRVIRGLSDSISDTSPSPAGNVVTVRFGASGRFVAATDSDSGLLLVAAFDDRNLETPHPLLASRFSDAEALVLTPPISSPGAERGPGPMVLRASGDGEIADTDVLYLTGLPQGTLRRGTLAGSLPVPTGDADSDTVEDSLDNCPLTPNEFQNDSNGNGIGNACEAGAIPALPQLARLALAALLALVAVRSSIRTA